MSSSSHPVFRLVLVALVAALAAAAGPTVNGQTEDDLMVQPIFVESVAEATQDLAALLGEQARTAVGAACPLEALKRIGMCTKILRTFLAPDPVAGNVQIVPHAKTFAANTLCSTLGIKYPTMNQNVCLQMANHIRIASGGYQRIITQSRQKDIHDVCATILSTQVNMAQTPRFITAEAGASCTLLATGGISGLRVLMLHGMGGDRLQYRGSTGSSYTSAYDGWLGSWPKYWGPEDRMDGLADVRFYVTETNQRGWNDLSVQREYCAAIDRFRPHAIFTHSMGNLIVSAAILNKIPGCTRISKTAGPNSVQWFANQAPWVGSPVATTTVNACKGTATGPAAQIRQGVTRLASNCNAEAATQSLMPSFRNTVSPAVQFANLRANAEQLLSGALCGYDAVPLNTREFLTTNGAGLWALCRFGSVTKMVNWGVDSTPDTHPITGNDGLVGYSSCKLSDAVRFGTSPSSAFYAGALSHEDGPCLVADKANNAAKQPCGWFVARANQARLARGLPAKAITAGNPTITVVPIISSRAASVRFAQAGLDAEGEQEAELDAELEAGMQAEALAAATAEVEEHMQQHAEAEAEAEVDAEADMDAETETEQETEQESEENHAHLEMESQHAAAAAAEAEAVAEAKAAAFAKLEADLAAEQAAEAENELVQKGLLDAPVSSLEQQDARLHAEVIMEQQHQRDLDAQMERSATELEAQIDAELD